MVCTANEFWPFTLTVLLIWTPPVTSPPTRTATLLSPAMSIAPVELRLPVSFPSMEMSEELLPWMLTEPELVRLPVNGPVTRMPMRPLPWA